MSSANANSRDLLVQSLLHLFQQALASSELGDAQLRELFASTEPFTLMDVSRTSVVSAITTDIEIIRSALAFIEFLSVAGDTVHVNHNSAHPPASMLAAPQPPPQPQPSLHHPSDHFVLTLRAADLPPHTTDATFATLFENGRTNQGNPCPQPTHIRLDPHTKLWVLNFSSEEDMRQAMGASKRMNIEGTPVKARLCFNYDGTILRRDRDAYHNPQYASNMMPPYPAPYFHAHGYPMAPYYPYAFPMQGGVRPVYPMDMMQPYFYPPQMATAPMYQYNMDPNYMQHGAFYYPQYPPRGNKYNRSGAGGGSSAGGGSGAGGGYGGRGYNSSGHVGAAGGYGRGRGYSNRMYAPPGPSVEHAGPSAVQIHEERVAEGGVERDGEATQQMATSSPIPTAGTPEPPTVASGGGGSGGGGGGVVYPIEDGRGSHEDDSEDADSQDATDSVDIAPLKVSEAAPSEEPERDRRPRSRPAGQSDSEDRRDSRPHARSRSSGGTGGPRERGGHGKERSGLGKDRSGGGYRKERTENRTERESRGRNDTRGEGVGGERRERAAPAPKLSMEVDFPVLGDHTSKASSPQFKAAPANYAFAVRNDATSAGASSPVSPVAASAATTAAAPAPTLAAPAPAPAAATAPSTVATGPAASVATGPAASVAAPSSHTNTERPKPADPRSSPQEPAVAPPPAVSAAAASVPVGDTESTLSTKKSFIDALKAKK